MKDSTPLPDHAGTVVIGAGIGGLLAAITAAGAAPGPSILVLDPHPAGGRARCDERDGFTFNRGPRALYASGVADRALRAAGVDTGAGGKPVLTGAAALHGGALHRFPGGPLDSLRTTLLTAREKVSLSALLAALWRADPASTDGLTVSGWLDDRGATGRVRQLLEALIRVGTYVDAPDHFAAGPALANAKLGISPGVRYLDGGWQSLVDQLIAVAARRRITFGSAAATSVRPAAGGRVEVATADGATVRAETAVIAAGGPDQAASLLGGPPASWGVLAPPVTAACLELGTAELPRHRFTLGIDVPLYASTHSPPARLAPPGHAVVHVMRYQRPGEDQAAAAQHEELLAFARQIGIAERDVVTERFLAKMTVAGTLPAAATGGLAGRPEVVVVEHPGVLLVGDWVGPTGLLLDAVAASATDAGRRAAARSASMVPA
jgi:phytoene dehydrogenase-like protein